MKKNFISWKYIDSPECFYDKFRLNDLFGSVRNKWIFEIEKAFGQDPKSFVLAGGNYSYFFLLSKSIKFIKKLYPYLPLHLKLVELRENSLELKDEHSFDLLLSSEYVDSGQDFFKDISNTGYEVGRKIYKDEIYFSASKESVKRFGSKEETLAKHNLLFGRVFSDNKMTNQLSYLFDIKPKGRERDFPKISSDQMFLSHMLMEDSVGIWLSFKSMPRNEKIVNLTKAIQKQKRFFVHKKNEDKISQDIRKRVMNMIIQKNDGNERDWLNRRTEEKKICKNLIMKNL